MIDLKKILKKINRYYLFINNIKKNKVSLVGTHNNKKEIFSILKNKIKKINPEKFINLSIVLLKISTVKFNPKQPIKMVFGPIKIDIIFHILSKKGSIKTNEFELRNNHLYYTLPYLEKNKISTRDFKKIVQLAIDNKLEKRLLAPKTIDQIKK